MLPLKLNYRNTWEVLAVAKAFAGEQFDGDAADDDTPMLIAPESVGRHGPHPQLLRYESRSAEAEAIAAQIDDARNDTCDLNQIAVIWRHWNQAETISRALTRRGIPFVWAKDSGSKDRLFEGEPSVKLVSMHSSKGLEFERVFIPAVDTMPEKETDSTAEAKLLYVAMTRATDRLVMTCAGISDFCAQIERGLVALDERDVA